MKRRILPSDLEFLSIITELSRALRCCRQDEVFCEDVTFTQFTILDAIARNETLHMAELHDALFVEKSTTTRLIAPLIKRNLLIRERAENDFRAATLKLTDEGREVHDKVWQCLLSFIRSVRAELPDEKRETILEGVNTFLRAMQNVSTMRCEGHAESARCRCGATAGIKNRY